MRYHYSDPTANLAISNADRELKRMRKWADSLKTRRMEGRLSKQAIEEARPHFVGIYKTLLKEALED